MCVPAPGCLILDVSMPRLEDSTANLHGLLHQMKRSYGREIARDRFLLQTLICKDAEQRLDMHGLQRTLISRAA
jgi:hypothetical protein